MGVILTQKSVLEKYFFYLSVSDFQMSQQKLSIISENKLKLSKNVNNKKHSKSILLNEKIIRKISMTFDIEH